MKKIVLMTLMLGMIINFKAAIDYNGTPINRSGGITITPQTSPAILASYTQAFNMYGLLDETFGQRGIVNTPGAGAGSAYAAVLQPDEKIIAVGYNGTTFELIRYNSNGSIDTSFNGGNPVVGANTTRYAHAALLQPDGKIVAVGVSSVGTGERSCLVRYNSDGSIDTSFNAGNPVIGANTTSIANAVLLQPDGKIVTAGHNSAGTGFCLARYNSDGSVDTTFNGGTPVIGAGTTLYAHAALLQPDGKIVAVGVSSVAAGSRFCLARYNSDGSIDTSFNGGNPVIGANSTGNAYAALLQPDGKIVAVGNSTGDLNPFKLARYNSDGSVDTTFNGGTPVVGPNTTGTIHGVLLQPNGKIVAVGSNNTGNRFCLTRYNSNGSIDTTFGPDNTNVVITTGTTYRAYAALLQPDGKIVAVGTNGTGTYDFVLIRYVNPFTLASFTASYGNVGMM